MSKIRSSIAIAALLALASAAARAEDVLITQYKADSIRCSVWSCN